MEDQYTNMRMGYGGVRAARIASALEWTLSLRRRTNVISIIIMDRGYESYNVIAHIDFMKQYYLLRIKDNNVGGFGKFFDKPATDEYDVSYTRKLTRQKARHYLIRNDQYVSIRHPYDLDFFTKEQDMYEMTFRLIRVCIAPGVYECFVTNLPNSTFTRDEIIEIYGLRWKIESAVNLLEPSLHHCATLRNY